MPDKNHNSQQQEAHGPRLTHLNEIATADMQRLCNIFSIVPLQIIMKGSSFEQVLVLKKKNVFFFVVVFFFIILPYMGRTVNDHLNKFSIPFQQQDRHGT